MLLRLVDGGDWDCNGFYFLVWFGLGMECGHWDGVGYRSDAKISPGSITYCLTESCHVQVSD